MKNLRGLPEAVSNPAATLLQSYMEEGIPANTGPLWSRSTLDEAIKNGPHAPACAPYMVSLIWEGLQRRIKDVFCILLSKEDAVQFFGENIKLLRISAVLLGH